jgi:hypothetical protein
MLKLSKKYAISDVGLRKICIGMDIPLPRAGHWMKLQAGKKVPQQKLPESYTGKTEVKLELREEGKKYHNELYSEAKRLQDEIKEKFKSELKVPERLTSHDPLIVDAKQSLAQKNKAYRFESIIVTSRGILDIQVSIENVSRALRFMDCFIKVVRLRGHTIVVNSGGTYLVIEEEKIKIACRERCKKVIVKRNIWDSTEFHANGLLYFKSEGYHGREWLDGKRPLEELIPNIIAKLELSVKDLHEAQEKNRIHYAKLEAERQRLRDIEARKEKELADFKSLLNEATRWDKAKMLRNYLETVEQKAIQGNIRTEEFNEWLSWAKKKADWYDPLIDSPDELLMNIL